jgi:hypothetical protein
VGEPQAEVLGAIKYCRAGKIAPFTKEASRASCIARPSGSIRMAWPGSILAAEKLSAMGGRWSRSKLSRIGNREQGVKDFDVERLLDAYEVTEPESRRWILGLVARVRERGYDHSQ